MKMNQNLDVTGIQKTYGSNHNQAVYYLTGI